MSRDTLETTHVSHSHDGEYDSDRGLDNAYPLDSQAAQSESRDVGPEGPGSIPGQTRRKLVTAMVKKDGKKETVTVDVYHPDDGDTSNEEDEEPDHVGSDSSDGETLWYLSSDAKKGTQHAIISLLNIYRFS